MPLAPVASLPLTRPAVTALAADPDAAARSLEAIDAADRRGDHDEACARAIARVVAGDSLPAATMARLFVFAAEYAVANGLAAIADGDRSEALLEVIERERFHGDPEGRAVALYAVFRIGVTPAQRLRLIAAARRMTRWRLDVGAMLILDALAGALGDPHLTELTKHCRGMATEPLGRNTLSKLDADLRSSAAEVVAALPEQAPPPSAAPAGFTVRAAVKPGRNEPCPCGSGLKYKKCCADKAPVVAGSPVAGMSWDDFLRAGADRLGPDDIDRLELRDLARVDLQRLGDKALVSALHAAMSWRSWDLVAQVLAAMDERPMVEQETSDGWRAEALAVMLDCGELAHARAALERMRDPEVSIELDRLQLELLEGPERIHPALTAAARRALADDTGTEAVDLAYALLGCAPALGVLVARGALRADRVLDGETLLEVVEEARDQLGLSPGDPAWDYLDALVEDDDADREHDAEVAAVRGAASRQAEQLRAELAAASARMAELEAQRASEQRALARLDAPAPASRTRRGHGGATPPSRGPARSSGGAPAGPPASPPSDPSDAAERRALRDKLELLQQRIRDGNDERADLRRRLAEAAAEPEPRRPAAPTEVAAPSSDDGADAGEPATAPRRPLVPRFDRRAEDALHAVPVQVAAEALRTLGELAAGDLAAWRGVKQAKDMSRAVLMARIGIHHRVLFVLEDRALHVLDLVTREELLHTLKRLR